MLAFSLPVIIWKMWLTNDCSFTVLFISKARAFLVLLQRNPLAAAVSFVQCWRSALFPELPHPWSETLEGNLWFKQLIFGLFFFFSSSLSVVWAQLPLRVGEGVELLPAEWIAIWCPQTEPLPSSWPCGWLQEQSSLQTRLFSTHATPRWITNKKPKNLPTKQACVFYLPWLKFHQYNGSVSKLRVFLQGGTIMLHLFLWHHDVI